MTTPAVNLGPLSPDELAQLKRLLAEPTALVRGELVLRMLLMIEARDAVIRDLAKAAGYDDGKFIPEKGSEP